MKPEVFFLKYAYPCAFIILQRKEITEKELEELEYAAVNEIALPREKLEKIFFRAFKRISQLAEELNKNKWDLEVIKEYFLNRHTELVEQGFEMESNIPKTLKELCKIHKAKVVERKKNLLVVKYNGRTRTVMNILTPSVRIGDTVTIHYGYAVEIVP